MTVRQSAFDRVRAGGWFGPAVLVLAAAYPMLALVVHNEGELFAVDRVVAGFLLTVAITLLTYVVVVASTDRVAARQLAAALAVFVLCFFSYGDLFGEAGRGRTRSLVVWLLLTGIVVMAAYRFAARDAVRFAFATFLGVIVLFVGAQFVVGVADDGGRREQVASEGAALPPVGEPPDGRPNVYWFVFDEYGRADQLAAHRSVDNGAMTEALEGRGFVVADDGYTSYPVTYFSLATVMNMDYLVTDEQSLGSGPDEETNPLRGGSPVGKRFADLGYRHLYSESGVHLSLRCNDDHVDVCLEQERAGADLGEVDLAMLNLTPLGEFDVFRWPHGDPVTVVEQVAAQRAEHPDTPVFTMAHILSPHEPYWYTEDCAVRDSPERGSSVAGYANEMRCFNERVLEAADLIIEEDPDAIVVLHSDTGPPPLTPFEDSVDEWTDEALTDRFAVFEAWRLPDGCNAPNGAHATVNTFRVVFGCIEGRTFDPIEPRYFLWRYEAPDKIEEFESVPWS